MDQTNTPLYDQLIHHHQKDPISLHVPGHKYGSIISEPNNSFFQELLKIDVTELTGLDDLHSPEGVISEAQTLLAALYRVKASFFLVNGSTVGNLAMIMATLKKNDTVLVQRNCHKSVLNALEIVGATPIFLDPEFQHKWGVASGVSESIVKKALNLYPNTAAIILTYPNYYGMANDIKRIIQLAHNRNIPVLVDEAHGAHFITGGSFPKSAVQLGADIVVQSAHKTLPAMTMGSYLHYNSNLIQREAVERYLSILQSSSPSYPIMASLDLARHYAGTYSSEDHLYLNEKISTFKDKLRELDTINVLEYDSEGDLLKITIQSTNNLNGFEMQSLLEKQGVYTELADPNNVLLIAPLLKKGMEFPFEQVIKTIDNSLKNIKKQHREVRSISNVPKISSLAIGYEESHKLSKRKVPLQASIGEIAAEKIIPYPPGIPVLFPGERITEELVEQLNELVNLGSHFQGSKDILQKEIYIFDRLC